MNTEHDKNDDEHDAESAENDEAQLYETTRTTTNRRDFMKGLGAAAGAAATGAGAQHFGAGPVQEAEAIAPVVVAGAAVAAGAGAAVGWALREYTAESADPPSTGLSASVLREQVYSTALTRESTNASTFVDNRNIIDGINHSAYADGKIAAIEALNNGKQKSAVKTAATSAVDSYETTVVKNLLKSWNESVNELDAMAQTISGHSSVTTDGLLEVRVSGDGGTVTAHNTMEDWLSPSTTSYQLADGSSIDVLEAVAQFNYDYDYGGSSYTNVTDRTRWSPINISDTNSRINLVDHRGIAFGSDGQVTYLKRSEWVDLLTSIESSFQSARDGLITWVDNIYDKVQSGTLDTAELLTPRELAEMTASEEDSFDQAVADLMALNIPTNLKRAAKIHIPSTGATLTGQISATSKMTLNAGTTIDPSAKSADFYFTYDVSSGKGTWDAYDSNKGVDGGVVAFTSEPYAGHEYVIQTTADEKATALAKDFSKVDGKKRWTVDLSSQLETEIANIEKVTYRSATDETKYETVQLQQKFEIKSFINQNTGEKKDSATVDHPSTPQTDNNYITEEEWKEMQKRQERLIEKYEQSQNSGGLVGNLFGSGSVPVWVPGGIIAAIIAYAATDGDDQ